MVPPSAGISDIASGYLYFIRVAPIPPPWPSIIQIRLVTNLFLNEAGVVNRFTVMEMSHKKSHKEITGFLPAYLRGLVNFLKIYTGLIVILIAPSRCSFIVF